MRIDHETPDGRYYRILDLEAGAEIKHVNFLDSETSTIRRYPVDENGNHMVDYVREELILITETRRFRVIDTRDDSEVCRTPGPSMTDHLRF